MKKSLLNNILESIKFRLSCFIFYLLAMLFRLTCKFRYLGVENLEKALATNKAYSLALWHENTLCSMLSQIGLKYCVLISRSKDGAFVDYLAHKMGFITARGSSSRGGKEAFEILLEKVGDGFSAAFAIDGPKGPRRKCKAGIIKLASLSQTPIIPVAAISTNPYILHKTWDQTKIPRLFSRVICQYGAPIYVPSNLSGDEFEKFMLLLEEKMDELQKETEQNILYNWSQTQKSFATS